MNKQYKFQVEGMHCKACVLMIESELGELPNVSRVKSNLHGNSVEVEGDFGDKTPEQVAEILSIPVRSHGYVISVQRLDGSATGGQEWQNKWADFKVAIPVSLGFILLFIFLQKIGIINLVNASEVTYGTAFVIGIIASLSTCMAVVGGLVLSMSATYAKEGSRVKPHLMFHIGRMVSFFVLGGVIGLIGSAFTLNSTATFVLSLIIGIVMLILGINLLGVFHWAKRLQPSMPKFISRHVHGISKFNHTFAPILIGLATFFLPCGFTQSMQLFTLSTGSFIEGGLTMFIFALGTLPVLALLSFGSFKITKSSKSGIFFKTAGLVVIMFAIFNFINSLVVIGILPPIFNF